MNRFSKRMALVGVSASLALAACQTFPAQQATVPAPAYWPTHGWQNGTPEDHGVDSAKLAEGLLAIRAKNLNIHSAIFVHNGKVIVDAYFYPYDGKTVHEVASVTKSVMTTLIAIAAEQGKLRLDQPIVSFFPDKTIANRDAWKEQVTVRHLASMSSGLKSVGHANDEGTLTEMTNSADWIQFALDRKVVRQPGSHFIYDSPSTHLLSAILQRATGMTALEFGRKVLFEPLGISEVIWETDPQGYTHGWADLFLHPRDMAKIGYLWLSKGVWEGKQIVSSQWVADSAKTQVRTGESDEYGYGWWVTNEDPLEYAAVGRSGQRVQVYPQYNALLVMTGGGVEYDDVVALLAPAIAKVGKPRAKSPDGAQQLAAALNEIARAPQTVAVAPLPEIARAISGRTYALEPNPLRLTSLTMRFDGGAEALFELGLTNNQPNISAKVGLDGAYRFSTWDHGLPLAMRGTWTDGNTFASVFDGIANRDTYDIHASFETDRVTMRFKERAHEGSVTIHGQLTGD